MYKWRIWLRKSTLLDLTERNANHIVPSYCHLPVSCRSQVDRCGSLGSCKPQREKWWEETVWMEMRVIGSCMYKMSRWLGGLAPGVEGHVFVCPGDVVPRTESACQLRGAPLSGRPVCSPGDDRRRHVWGSVQRQRYRHRWVPVLPTTILTSIGFLLLFTTRKLQARGLDVRNKIFEFFTRSLIYVNKKNKIYIFNFFDIENIRFAFSICLTLKK